MGVSVLAALVLVVASVVCSVGECSGSVSVRVSECERSVVAGSWE